MNADDSDHESTSSADSDLLRQYFTAANERAWECNGERECARACALRVWRVSSNLSLSVLGRGARVHVAAAEIGFFSASGSDIEELSSPTVDVAARAAVATAGVTGWVTPQSTIT